MISGWALFLSGRGSTAQSLMDLLGDLDIRLVVSSRKNAPGLLRAKRMGLPVLVMDQNPNWLRLSQDLKRRGVSKIFLVGFMKILPPDFLEDWLGQIWNVHPSLLPLFAGKEALKRSFEANANLGITIHDVTSEMDAGPRRLQLQLNTGHDWEKVQILAAKGEQRLLREWALRVEQRGEL